MADHQPADPAGSDRSIDPRLAALPPDVQEWLTDTYLPEGIRLWLNAYDRGDDAKREQLVMLARIDPMGT